MQLHQAILVLILFSATSFADTSVVVRLMTANLTSGRYQRYEAPGIRIFQGLRPDVVTIQEFNYVQADGAATNTPAALREFVDAAFGLVFSYYREPYEGPGDIPNGIVSRWPIRASGSWDDPEIPNRGFAWARIDLPGTNDLYAVSVHLSSGGPARKRANEATALKGAVLATFPKDAWVVVGGDFNHKSRDELAMRTLRTFVSDAPVPTDATTGGDPDTNRDRSHAYDALLVSHSLTNALVPVVVGARVFRNGLVFDSRVFTPLTDVAPVQASDCDTFQMQHLAVIRAIRVPVSAE